MSNEPGDRVLIKRLSDTDRDMSYAGYTGEISKVDGNKALVRVYYRFEDSAIRVYFEEWFYQDELEVVK